MFKVYCGLLLKQPLFETYMVELRQYPTWNIHRKPPYASVREALLQGRGLEGSDVDVGAEALHAPELLKDLIRATQRIEQAIKDRSLVIVFGDYDADGITSTALLLDFLNKVGANCDYMLPNRHRDGYGIRSTAVESALERNAGLIITVDYGISACDALQLAHSKQLDVIVLDHHPQFENQPLPLAHSIVNPNRLDCDYPFKGLVGVGVTFKVVQVLSASFMNSAERGPYLNQLLEFVALGSVADVAPVLDENRVMIRRGLRAMQDSKRPGIKHLKVVAGCDNDRLDTTSVGFYLGPRINSAGRMASPDLALRLLLSDDEDSAKTLADELNDLNRQRRDLQREGTREAEKLISEDELEMDRILVLLGEEWNLGIIGLIASALQNKYHRPAVVVTDVRRDGIYSGSARSISAYEINLGIKSCANHLLTFGGHPAAAGFSLKAEHFESFRIDLISHANQKIAEQDLEPSLEIDLLLNSSDISAATLDTLEQMEPFGRGFESPIFAVENLEILGCNRVGKGGEHLKAIVNVEGRSNNAVWWRQGHVASELSPGDHVSVAFELKSDTYAGSASDVQLVIRDMHKVRAVESNVSDYTSDTSQDVAIDVVRMSEDSADDEFTF